jgi:hypothetical protein
MCAALTSLDPAFGIGGETVTVKGNYFVNNSLLHVKFDTQKSDTTFVDNSTVINKMNSLIMIINLLVIVFFRLWVWRVTPEIVCIFSSFYITYVLTYSLTHSLTHSHTLSVFCTCNITAPNNRSGWTTWKNNQCDRLLWRETLHN